MQTIDVSSLYIDCLPTMIAILKTRRRLTMINQLIDYNDCLFIKPPSCLCTTRAISFFSPRHFQRSLAQPGDLYHKRCQRFYVGFGTASELNRYDGYTFKVFSP